jgi:hypothetical protein
MCLFQWKASGDTLKIQSPSTLRTWQRAASNLAITGLYLGGAVNLHTATTDVSVKIISTIKKYYAADWRNNRRYFCTHSKFYLCNLCCILILAICIKVNRFLHIKKARNCTPATTPNTSTTTKTFKTILKVIKSNILNNLLSRPTFDDCTLYSS